MNGGNYFNEIKVAVDDFEIYGINELEDHEEELKKVLSSYLMTNDILEIAEEVKDASIINKFEEGSDFKMDEEFFEANWDYFNIFNTENLDEALEKKKKELIEFLVKHENPLYGVFSKEFCDSFRNIVHTDLSERASENSYELKMMSGYDG